VSGHRPEVADVIRNDGARFLKRYRPTKEQFRVLNDLAKCRTAALGGHLKQCDTCAREIPVYNSCRNRHCPKCHGAARAAWLDAREREVLDVQYFHVVFTLPHELAPLVLQNRRAIYSMLFRAASETLTTLARDPKYLGAELGCVALLHTWGQNLLLHPHLHCVIPGGGLSADGERWVSCRDGFFLPVRVMSRLFRGKFTAFLQSAYDEGELQFFGRLQQLSHPNAWDGWLDTLRNKPWLVYAKPPFGGPRQVLKYLARYTHRVAIANSRLISTDNAKVAFRWKDYANQNQHRIMTLDAVEFLRRFLLHVLPKRFMRVRYYGFLANRHRQDKLESIRRLLGQAEPSDTEPSDSLAAVDAEGQETTTDSADLCPECRKGRLRLVAPLTPQPVFFLDSWSFDSS
jgi:hypothetical protein